MDKVGSHVYLPLSLSDLTDLTRIVLENYRGMLAFLFLFMVAQAQVIRYMDLFNGANCLSSNRFGWSQQAFPDGIPCQSLQFQPNGGFKKFFCLVQPSTNFRLFLPSSE